MGKLAIAGKFSQQPPGERLYLKQNPPTMNTQKNNPLHGITLEQILVKLVEHYGWQQLGEQINIRCFQSEPSIKSSLKFLRKTPWARSKVEHLFIDTEFAAPT